MPRTVTTTTQMQIFDDAIIVDAATNVTITLPPVADCAGRTYRIARYWASGDPDISVTVQQFSGDTAFSAVIPATVQARNTSIVVSASTEGTTWTKAADATVITGNHTVTVDTNTGSSTYGTVTDAYGGRYLFDTTAATRVLTLPNINAGMVSRKTRLYISNYNGKNNVTVNCNTTGTTDLFYMKTLLKHADGYISDVSDELPWNSISIPPGEVRIIYVAADNQWRDSRRDITFVNSAQTIASTATNVAVYGANAVELTLGTADARLVAQTPPTPALPLTVVISNMSGATVSVLRSGSDTIDSATSANVPRNTSLPFTVAKSAVWRTTNATLTTTDRTSTALDPADEFVVVAAASDGTSKTLPVNATSSTKTLQIRNTGTTGVLTIQKHADKKLFTSTGYVASTTIAANRSATFVYSAGLDAWVRA